ncbi:TadE family protein [Candidatus Riflebacteria bacterium]
MPYKKRSKSQAMVEIALTLPIFLFVVFALMDFSYRFYLQLCLDDIALEAAQYGATRNETLGYPAGMAYDPAYDFTPTKSMIESFILTINRSGIKPASIVKTVSTTESVTIGATTLKAVKVSLTYPLQPLTPLLNSFSENWSLKSEALITKKGNT